MLIPNGITSNTAINYELTGYINDINTEYTQVLTEFGANGSTTNIYEHGEQRNSATINGTKGYYTYDGRGWFRNAVNSVKRTASKAVNAVKRGVNTAKSWANTHIVQPVKSFISNTKQTVSNSYQKAKTTVKQKYNQAKQSYNNAKTWVNNK